jgi:hypothetical protein
MPIRHGDILAKRASDLTTRPLLPKHDCATTIEPNDVERGARPDHPITGLAAPGLRRTNLRNILPESPWINPP